MNNTQKSLIAILICYFSWGLFPIYFKLLKEIGAYEVLAMRIICSFIFMIIVVAISKNKKSIFNEITTLWKDKKSVLLLVLQIVDKTTKISMNVLMFWSFFKKNKLYG